MFDVDRAKGVWLPLLYSELRDPQEICSENPSWFHHSQSQAQTKPATEIAIELQYWLYLQTTHSHFSKN